MVVQINTHVVKPDPPGTACIDLAKIEHAKVTLDRPLGDRKVVDVTAPPSDLLARN